MDGEMIKKKRKAERFSVDGIITDYPNLFNELIQQ